MKYFWLFLICATPAVAQDAPDASCSGTDPDWTLEIDQNTAVLDYLRVSDLTLAMTTTPAGSADWPQAYTFIGRGDSAIVISEARDQNNLSTVRVLTQRGEVPILLVGTCRPN